jgi:hypothetical protein
MYIGTLKKHATEAACGSSLVLHKRDCPLFVKDYRK